MSHPDLREEVARVARRMGASGLVTGTSGNVSVRTPEGEVLITPSGLDYAILEPEEVVRVCPEGKVLEGSLNPSTETPMHVGIYRSRPRVKAIVHTHSRYSTVLGCLGWEIPPVHYMLAALSSEGRVPIASYAAYGTEELARHASEALGDSHNACLLRNHGTIVVGETGIEAYSRAELLEEMAEIYYRSRLAGEPSILSTKEVDEIAAKMTDYGQPSASICEGTRLARAQRTESRRMNGDHSSGASTARSYYDSGDADNFYQMIWGGEDIHVGLYESEGGPITEASRRTVERMASRLEALDENSRVLDIGSGYGGPARFLAGEYGCGVVALNQSEVENWRARELNREQGTDDSVEVVGANFEDIPYPDEAFDVVWSQEAILHSEERAKVLEEVARVLKPGAEFIFTDPMRADDCPDGVLEPILERLYLGTMASPEFYREQAQRLGLEEIGFEEHAHQLANHYARVLEETERRDDTLSSVVSREYIEHMKEGLRHWVEGGRNGYLTWGIFHFRKRS